MSEKYVLGIDQSTQGTKALLFSKTGELLGRSDLAHRQIINEKGWVEHDPEEIYKNTVQAVKNLIEQTKIETKEISCLGISNQRETAVVWERETGKPVFHAIVWQCARGEAVCFDIRKKGYSQMVQEHTGLPLSPYFTAAKIAWILQNVEGAAEKSAEGKLCCGTMDSWLIYNLTGGKQFKTDYSNASRTQMFHITELKWDEEVCSLFGINTKCLAEVCFSDEVFGITDFDGYLKHPIPIHSVLGDSHGALFGQGCLEEGMIKSTYGTGSSVMMNIGETPVFSKHGVVTSLAWGMGGKVCYVLEGNINYTGAVISWIEKDLQLAATAKETEYLARSANPVDKTYLVPAFTGLGAPYWDSSATGIICGISRTTGRSEIVKAALDCIAYQITDIVEVMRREADIQISDLRVDGGPTKNGYLMQFQSDMLGISVQVPDSEELSGIGAAYAAGIAMGIYDKNTVFERMRRIKFVPEMEKQDRDEKYNGWKKAVQLVLSKF